MLLMHTNKSSRRAPDYLTLPHAIVVRLHVHKINVVILTPETAVTVGV